MNDLKLMLVENKQMYLTEQLLSIYLQYIFHDYEIIHNKTVPFSDIKNRPDFRIEKLKLIIEFDGYRHYNCTKTILKDKLTTQIWESLGYEVIRIPYFIQMNRSLLKTLYCHIGNCVDEDIVSEYKCGFIDENALRVKDFCYYGILRFLDDCYTFDYCKTEIYNSLDDIDFVVVDSFTEYHRVRTDIQ